VRGRSIPLRGALWASAALWFLSPLRPEEERAAKSPGESGPVRDLPFDETLYLPLRFHVLQAESLPQVNSSARDDDLARRAAGASRIWGRAGIRVYLESILREPASGQDRFKLALSLDAVHLGLYESLAPKESRSAEALDVYLVAEMPANGVYFSRTPSVFIKERPSLDPVPGGTDFPPERVLSHEIGHHLTLEHAADRSLLMSSGTTGFGLDPGQIQKARQAAAGRGALTAVRMVERAEEEARTGRAAAARRRLEALVATPGESALKERARKGFLGLQVLQPPQPAPGR
jgi:hypothetical protein